jgi:1,4-alpha-glucan branching enzyme
MAKKSGNKEIETMESFSLLTDFDIHLFKSGKHYKLYEKLGARITKFGKQEGAYFAVWAPNAKSVSVIGNFNHWANGKHKLNPRWDQSGIWEGFFPEIKHGEAYKYAIHSNTGEYLEKSDPFSSYCEEAPKTASIIWEPKYEWTDHSWLAERKLMTGKAKAYSVYEVHFGSWRRKIEGNKSLTYPEMAIELVNYVKDLGFTHVEFLPIMEHPFYVPG